MVTASALFNNSRAVNLYQLYQDTHDVQYRDELITFCLPLFEVLAKQRNPALADDIVQDAVIKVMGILEDDLYTPAKGTLYSFLYSVITNLIRDIARRNNKRPECLDFESLENLDIATVDCPACVESIRVDDLLWYLPRRFYEFDKSVTKDMARYLFDAIPLNICTRDARKTKLTLMTFYEIEEAHAVMIYNVAEIIMRTFSLDVGDPTQALLLVRHDPSHYWTYNPELSMFLQNGNIDIIAKVFRNITVRF